MRALQQRVSRASVSVDEKVVGEIGYGLWHCRAVVEHNHQFHEAKKAVAYQPKVFSLLR